MWAGVEVKREDDAGNRTRVSRLPEIRMPEELVSPGYKIELVLPRGDFAPAMSLCIWLYRSRDLRDMGVLMGRVSKQIAAWPGKKYPLEPAEPPNIVFEGSKEPKEVDE
jgi:hypothetical protein